MNENRGLVSSIFEFSSCVWGRVYQILAPVFGLSQVLMSLSFPITQIIELELDQAWNLRAKTCWVFEFRVPSSYTSKKAC